MSMIILLIIIVALLIACANLWVEKEHWLEMFIKEKQKGYPDMWYSGKDGQWHEVYYGEH